MGWCKICTRIVGDFSGRGHVVTEADIPELLKLGKEHLYIWEKRKYGFMKTREQSLHRALRRRPHSQIGNKKKEKLIFFSEIDGLLKVDTERLKAVNLLEMSSSVPAMEIFR